MLSFLKNLFFVAVFFFKNYLLFAIWYVVPRMLLKLC